MLRIGKGNGQILLSCQSDRKQAKHLTLYKQLYKRRILHNQFTSNLQKKFCKSYWHSAYNVYNRQCWRQARKHSRDARQARKRTAGRPEGHDVKVFLENCTTFGKMWGIMRRLKRVGECKATNRNKHRTFTSALQDARIPRAQRPIREGKGKHEN